MNHLKRFFPVALLLLTFLVASVTFVYADKPNQQICPVMKGPVNRAIHTDYQGKRIFFCCPPCVGQFEKAPEKFMKQLEKEGVILENAPTAKK